MGSTMSMGKRVREVELTRLYVGQATLASVANRENDAEGERISKEFGAWLQEREDRQDLE